MKPELKELKEYKDYDIVPVYEELFSDSTWVEGTISSTV